VFLVGTMAFGFLWAWLLDRPVRFEGVFRSVYLFPMAVSFVASGVVWRWLLNSNQDEAASGLNRLFQTLGLGFLQNSWWNNVSWGIAAIAIPAVWQLSGYVMALFLAGFRGIPTELREAARMDGASEWKLYRHVIFPQLSPVALAAVIVVGHMSLKAFDLIMSISKPANYQTKVPAIDMYVFKSSFDYADSAAVGVVLLVIVAVLIVPYLIHLSRAEKES
jgi:glucose/mannose transport system permease protein